MVDFQLVILDFQGGTPIPLFLRTVFEMFSIQVEIHEAFNKYLGSTYPNPVYGQWQIKKVSRVSLVKM